MKPLNVVVMTIGAIIAGIGVVGVAAPSVLLDFGRSLLTPAALYVVAAGRIAFGSLLLWVAPMSRMPKTIRTIGIVVIVAGLLTPLFGVERSEAVFNWWSSQGPLFVRAFPALAIGFGAFVAYVVTSRR